MKIPDDLKDQLTEYRNIPILQKNRLLHLKGGRINTATLFILLSKISKYKLLNGLKKIYIEEQSKVKILSTFKLLEEIKNLVDTNTAFKQNNGALPIQSKGWIVKTITGSSLLDVTIQLIV